MVTRKGSIQTTVVEYSINRLMKRKLFRKTNPTLQGYLMLKMTIIMIILTITLILSSSISAVFAEKKSPRDVCKINQNSCWCDSLTKEGNAKCCTFDTSGRKYCDICDIDLATGDYINCHPEDNIKFPSQTDLPDNITVSGTFEQEEEEHNFDKGSNLDSTTIPTTRGTFNEDSDSSN